MRRLSLLVGLAVATTSTAHAEPAEPVTHWPVAVGVNLPLIWSRSFAASAWGRLDEHYAVRANVARYRGPLLARTLSSIYSDGDDGTGAAPDFGHTTDASLGLVYYPRRTLEGVSLEVGVLCRFNRLRDRIDDDNVAGELHRTNVYSARVLAGWTGHFTDSWFLAVGLGGSLGYERGRERVFVDYDQSGGFHEIFRDGRVSRADASVEAYLRVGFEFGPSFFAAPAAQDAASRRGTSDPRRRAQRQRDDDARNYQVGYSDVSHRPIPGNRHDASAQAPL